MTEENKRKCRAEIEKGRFCKVYKAEEFEND